MPISEARLAANRKNAQRSTGPRTPEGKERSRQNAVKHGLTGAGIALPSEDVAVVEGRFLALRDQLDPKTPMGGILVKRVAMLSVRLDRSYRRETAALSVRVIGADSAMRDARRAEAEYLIHHINLEPRTNHRRLMAMPEGVDLLIDAWERMNLDLEDQTGTRWTYHHAHQADHFHGIDASTIAVSPYLAWTKAIHGNFDALRPDRFAEGMTKTEKEQHALVKLHELVEAEITRLRAYRATMDTSEVDAKQAHAVDLALFDDSKEAILARKYEAAAERGMFRALEELRQVEAEAEAEADVKSVVPEAPEPIDPPGTLGSFFQAPAPPVAEAMTTAWPLGSGPFDPIRRADFADFAIGRPPEGPN